MSEMKGWGTKGKQESWNTVMEKKRREIGMKGREWDRVDKGQVKRNLPCPMVRDFMGVLCFSPRDAEDDLY